MLARLRRNDGEASGQGTYNANSRVQGELSNRKDFTYFNNDVTQKEELHFPA